VTGWWSQVWEAIVIPAVSRARPPSFTAVEVSGRHAGV
jgi:hypothetical protein